LVGRRSEQRIVILIPVIVRGTDARGSPFELKAETCDISVNGARLRGLADVAAPGNKIEVECKGKTAWYRIEWVGKTRTLSANQLGIRLLDPGKYIWGIPPKEWAADTFNSAQLPGYDRSALPGLPQKVSQAPPAGEDRRRFPRKPYRIETQVSSDDSYAKQPGMITDISLGGCYVEMLGPLPVNTAVELHMDPGDAPLHLSGIVRSSHTGLGMGIEFTAMNPMEYEQLRRIAPPMPVLSVPSRAPSRPPMPQPRAEASSPGYKSSTFAESSNNHLTTTAEALEAMMRVLFRKGLLTRAELTEELETLKTARVESVR
jgi:hypothetical protein